MPINIGIEYKNPISNGWILMKGQNDATSGIRKFCFPLEINQKPLILFHLKLSTLT